MSTSPMHEDNLQHRIFRSDAKLSPEEINHLLGVRVTIQSHSLGLDEKQSVLDSCTRVFRFALITIALSSVALMGSMYQLEIGPFHESISFASMHGK